MWAAGEGHVENSERVPLKFQGWRYVYASSPCQGSGSDRIVKNEVSIELLVFSEKKRVNFVETRSTYSEILATTKTAYM